MITFNQNESWEFDPLTMKSEIIKFLEYERERTQRTQEISGKNKKQSLKKEIEKLILFMKIYD
ncbi:MAG: hypothetical protein ACTSPD_08200 [Promethearchaeota archaeon]